MKFTYEQLKEKHTPGIDKLLILSFEYLVCCISKTYCERNNINTLEDFNKKNDLTFSKMLAYPFFVSLSNGHSHSLYNLFGNFYSINFAPISFDILSLWKSKESEFKYFNFFSKNNLNGLEVKSLFLQINFDEIKELIKKEEVSFNNDSKKFSEILIFSDSQKEKNIYLAIENGVNAVNDQSGGKFFTSGIEQITLQATFFDAYLKRNKKEEVSLIEYDEVKDNEKPFFSEEAASSL